MRAATGRALRDMGVDLADKAAVKTAMESTEFATRIANDATLAAAQSGVRNAARNVGVAALEPAGEFAGEYLGQGVATGDYDVKNATLEALSSVGQSGMTFAGQKAYSAAKYPFRAEKKASASAGEAIDASEVLGAVEPEARQAPDQIPIKNESRAVVGDAVAAQVADQANSSPQDAPEAPTPESALLSPKNLTDLDRVGQIEERMREIGPRAEAGDVEADAEWNALRAQREAITANWPNAVPGARTSFSTGAGVRLDGQYALMEADDVTASHDEYFRPSENHPAQMQPKDRGSYASKMQISDIVQKLDPHRLGASDSVTSGAPVIGADGLVESGNARTIAIKQAYQSNGQHAEDYRQYLRENAESFGLDPETVDAMNKPVLVRVRQTPVDRAEFARQANTPEPRTAQQPADEDGSVESMASSVVSQAMPQTAQQQPEATAALSPLQPEEEARAAELSLKSMDGTLSQNEQAELVALQQRMAQAELAQETPPGVDASQNAGEAGAASAPVNKGGYRAFKTAEKAQSLIDDLDLGDTHIVSRVGNRYLVRKKAQAFANQVSVKHESRAATGGAPDSPVGDQVKNESVAGESKEEHSERRGDFGPIFKGYYNDPQGAIDRLMREKTGEALDAFVHKELGPIAFVYGNEKMGLRHIEAKHGAEQLAKVPRVLREGRLERDPDGHPRAWIVDDSKPAEVVAIRLDWNGQDKTWMVSSFPAEYGRFAEATENGKTRGQREANRNAGIKASRIPDATGQKNSSVDAQGSQGNAAESSKSGIARRERAASGDMETPASEREESGHSGEARSAYPPAGADQGIAQPENDAGTGAWMLTAFGLSEGASGKGYDNTAPTDSTPTLSRDATGASNAASDSRGAAVAAPSDTQPHSQRGRRLGTDSTNSVANAAAESKVSEVRAHVDSITAQWKRAPEVIVANSMQDDVIPEAVRQHDQTMKSRGATGEPEGFIYQGKVYLIAGQLDSLQDVSRTLFHEALGHHGLHGVFGGLLDTNLIELAALRRKEIVAKGQAYGLLPKLPENATLSEKWQAMGKENRLIAAEEVLAEMAQNTPDSN